MVRHGLVRLVLAWLGKARCGAVWHGGVKVRWNAGLGFHRVLPPNGYGCLGRPMHAIQLDARKLAANPANIWLPSARSEAARRHAGIECEA
jgi:hypothetical protein